MSHTVPHCAGEVLERALKEQPTREALVAIDRRFTYEQLDEEIERAAAAIGALGSEPVTWWRSASRTPVTSS